MAADAVHSIHMKPHVAFELAVPLSAVDHVRGGPHAQVSVVEYGDFECPNCRQAQPAMELLLARFTGRAQFAFRHFPLEEVHPHALLAAQAAECAGGQGKFWEMYELLFTKQEHLKAKDLRAYAEGLGLDMARYTAEMDDQIYLQRVREQLQGGLDSGVRATPTFFIDGRITDVSFGLRALFDAVETVLHPAAHR
jgi:protein-disulfide isomerase